MQISGLVHPYIQISNAYPIDITVSSGNALCICGGNGSGKTTFLKLLLKELQPKRGSIKNISEISFLGIQNGLKPEILVKQQLPFFMANQAKFPWPEFLDRTYKCLSSGQKRLVAVWLALHRQKPLILLDEPFSHLDDNSVNLAIAWINQQLAAQSKIIFTHHNLEGLKNIQSLQILDLSR